MHPVRFVVHYVRQQWLCISPNNLSSTFERCIRLARCHTVLMTTIHPHWRYWNTNYPPYNNQIQLIGFSEIFFFFYWNWNRMILSRHPKTIWLFCMHSVLQPNGNFLPTCCNALLKLAIKFSTHVHLSYVISKWNTLKDQYFVSCVISQLKRVTITTTTLTTIVEFIRLRKFHSLITMVKAHQMRSKWQFKWKRYWNIKRLFLKRLFEISNSSELQTNIFFFFLML